MKNTKYTVKDAERYSRIFNEQTTGYSYQKKVLFLLSPDKSQSTLNLEIKQGEEFIQNSLTEELIIEKKFLRTSITVSGIAFIVAIMLILTV